MSANSEGRSGKHTNLGSSADNPFCVHRRNGKPTSLGCFDHEVEASQAYDKMMLWCELHGSAGVKGGITNFDASEYEDIIPWLQSITQVHILGHRPASTLERTLVSSHEQPAGCTQGVVTLCGSPVPSTSACHESAARARTGIAEDALQCLTCRVTSDSCHASFLECHKFNE